MTENMFAQAHFIDDFTKNELDEAAQELMKHQIEFLSNTDAGHNLRRSAIKIFKEDNCIKTDDRIALSIEADLANDVDIHNALEFEMS